MFGDGKSTVTCSTIGKTSLVYIDGNANVNSDIKEDLINSFINTKINMPIKINVCNNFFNHNIEERQFSQVVADATTKLIKSNYLNGETIYIEEKYRLIPNGIETVYVSEKGKTNILYGDCPSNQLYGRIKNANCKSIEKLLKKYRSNVSVSRCYEKQNQLGVIRQMGFNDAKINVKPKFEQKIIFNPINTIVNTVENIESQLILNMQPATTIVESLLPPGGNSGIGNGGLKFFKLVAQKFSYFEYEMKLNNEIKNVIGLPYGLVFFEGKIQGSPLISGLYNITIDLGDNNSFNGQILVPELPRNL